jgi:hypothetical protein
MYTEKHFIELFNDHDYRQSCIQFCIKTKCDRLYTILQKNGGTDTKPMGKTEPQFLSDPMSDRKNKFSPTL